MMLPDMFLQLVLQMGASMMTPGLAVELLERLCKSCSERHFHAYADSAYGGQSVLAHLPANWRPHQPPASGRAPVRTAC